MLTFKHPHPAIAPHDTRHIPYNPRNHPAITFDLPFLVIEGKYAGTIY